VWHSLGGRYTRREDHGLVLLLAGAAIGRYGGDRSRPLTGAERGSRRTAGLPPGGARAKLPPGNGASRGEPRTPTAAVRGVCRFHRPGVWWFLYAGGRYEHAAWNGQHRGAWGRGGPVTSQIVTYQVDESTIVKFEIEPTEGFRPAGPDQVLGWVKEAVAPAVEAAKAVLDKVKEARPDQIEMKVGIKVSGGTNWLVAKTAGEGNFEITLTWSRDAHQRSAGGE
jgi:hypothetical protein